MKLLLNLTKILLILLIIFFSTGCIKKTNSKSYYKLNSYKKSTQYKKIQNQTIKNSAAMHRATMRSYVIKGKRYYPAKTTIGAKYNGIASWYGLDFHAKKTSNGEIYNMFASTAASKTLPMNTMVKVYNKDNGKSTIVRINDRGPFVVGRIIDLSNKAAHEIDMEKKGIANVQITIIGFNGKINDNDFYEKEQILNIYKYFVQVGAFSKFESAINVRNKFNQLILTNKYKAKIKQNHIRGILLNRVLVGEFTSEEEAINFKKENGLENAIIVVK